ncbi:glutamyl aminopeptidase-like [Haliotis rubra]|uniref:glutamyl aminopeptidase-like n=1 Tax=Haliotis rubra TaxID=36100 RepID=UPI001EE5DC9F|nr:glutamyl aminopeptidase-like [Haliotis rubra]
MYGTEQPQECVEQAQDCMEQSKECMERNSLRNVWNRLRNVWNRLRNVWNGTASGMYGTGSGLYGTGSGMYGTGSGMYGTEQPQECMEQAQDCMEQPKECMERNSLRDVSNSLMNVWNRLRNVWNGTASGMYGTEQPQECMEQAQDCMEQAQECMEQPQECMEQPHECMEQAQECMEQPQECMEQPEECMEQPEECMEMCGSYLQYNSVASLFVLHRYLASSQLQPTDTRRVFPCFDEPDFKAIFKITIIHQPGYQALGNMPLYRSSVLSNGWLRKEFEPTPIMSTYILAFVVADFKSRNYSFNSGYQLRIWAQPDAYSQTKHALDFGVKTYNFFTEYFNTSDVVPKADHVAVPDFSGGAMENWGLVIYRETALLYDPYVSSSSNKYMVTLIMAHEIAHTWFGNMVTMKWWDDLWLNEGFASLLMYFAMDNAYPEWNVFAIQVVEYMFPAMVKDALVTSHPVSADIEDPDDVQQSFDIISYNKGMAVLRMLQGFIGWKSFKEGLQLYVRRYKFQNADRDELWQTFTETVNNTYIVKKIMDTWTRQTGYPVVNVRTVNNSFILEQERFLLNQEEADPLDDNPFGYRWYIPFTYIIQYDRNVRKVWLNLEAATINRTEGWVLGNVDYMGFFRVNYEKDMWMRLGDQLLYNHTVFSEANRAGLIGDAFALARANLLDYDIALNLTRYLKNELNYVPWRAFVDSIEFLRGMIATKEAYVYLQQYLRDLVTPVYNTATYVKGSLPDKYLHRIILGMACDVGVGNAVKYAKSTFNAWKTYNTVLAADLSVLIYSVGIREGGTDEWDFVWEKAQSTSVASERQIMMEALAQTQKPWLLWRYANWVFDPSKIKKQDVRVVMTYFTKTPLARSVALEFFMTRWKDLVNRFGHDPFLLPEVIPTVTSFVNSEFHLRQLETIFKETPPKTASKAAENALALTRSNIKWMETYYEKIAVWLKDNVT